MEPAEKIVAQPGSGLQLRDSGAHQGFHSLHLLRSDETAQMLFVQMDSHIRSPIFLSILSASPGSRRERGIWDVCFIVPYPPVFFKRRGGLK